MPVIWFIQLIAVALKEVRQTLRDARMLVLLLGAPVVQLGVFGVAVDFDVDRVPTLLVDHDRTSESRQAALRLFADRTLVQVDETDSDAASERALDRNDALAVVIFERGFADNLRRGKPARVQVVVDGTDPNRSSVASSTVQRWARTETAGIVVAALTRRASALVAEAVRSSPPGAAVPSIRRPTQVGILPRVLHNPRLKTAIYVVPGIAAMLLLVVTLIVTAMGLARERETGTLEQVLVTPLSPAVLLIGKLLPYLCVGVFDWAVTLAVGAYAFDVPLRGNLFFLFTATLAYLTSTLGLGLLISTVSQTQQQAFVGGFLLLLPLALLSGIMTPLLGIPDWLRPLTYLNPVRYYAEIQRGVLLRGAGFADLWVPMVALVSLGCVVLTVAALRFRRKLG